MKNNNFENILNEFTFLYLANDVYQGTGPDFFLKNYHILTFDHNPLVDLVRKYSNVFTVEEAAKVKNQTFRNSSNLTQFKEIIDYIQNISGNKKIITFKNSASLMSIVDRNNWDICASNPELGRFFENKLKSTKYFQDLGLLIPKTKILRLEENNLFYSSVSNEFGEKFVVQLAKGFGGSHTFIITNEDDFLKILPRISGREIKITEFIQGQTITINACVTSNGVISARPFKQFTGIEECTNNKASAVGNDWNDLGLPIEHIKKSTHKVGEYMQKKGYRGIFGLDMIIDAEAQVYFIETNARMINSIPYFTQLQILNNEIPLSMIHILEYLGETKNINISELDKEYTNNLKGAQIIVHNKENSPKEIQGDIKPGVYKFINNKLEFCKLSYRIMDCTNKDEFLILPKEKARVVNPEMEIARIQTINHLADNNGNVLPGIKKLINEVYNTLIL